MEKIISCEEKNNSSSESIFHKLHWKQRHSGAFKLSLADTALGKKSQESQTGTRKLSTEKEKITTKVIDNSEKYKVDMIVMTEWGIGKIISINEGGIAIVKIEGSEVEFPLMSLNTSLTVYCCILCKDSSNWIEIKVEFDFAVYALKKKIALMLRCHPSQVILIHGGRKVDKNVNIFELGIYEKDVFLAIIKDPQELSVMRSKSIKTSTKQPIYNAIRVKVNQDIILTALGLFKNNMSDVYYDMLIFEEDQNNNLKLVYSEKKILVKSEGVKENTVFKHKISNIELKENVNYQIHQYLNQADSNQNLGVKCNEEVVEKFTQITFQFSNCKIQGRTNSTDTEEGMIPMIYFYIKTENQ